MVCVKSVDNIKALVYLPRPLNVQSLRANNKFVPKPLSVPSYTGSDSDAKAMKLAPLYGVSMTSFTDAP